jgi:transposase InsO family protein
MLIMLVSLLHCLVRPLLHVLRFRFLAWCRPATHTQPMGVLGDLLRSRRDLVAENALLRQQLIVLRRRRKRPTFTRLDRLLLVVLAGRVRAWRQALVIVQPETLLRWHRAGFRLLWRHRSKRASRNRRVAPEAVALIQQLARENRLWGAERIRGELLKLGIRVCKRTVRKYMRQAGGPRPQGQTWAAFLRNHGRHIWACDFLQTFDLFFRPVFSFFIVELASHRVVHVGVTRQPTDAWVAQQLGEATPFGQHPKHLIRDNEGKFGPAFARVAEASGIEEVRIAHRAPQMNAIVERFLGSVRRKCLDHLFILGDRHLGQVLKEYTEYFNRERPHQGLGQALPESAESAESPADSVPLRVQSTPVLGGLHHAYSRAA